jgi:PIN domain nuclease of toxin-antitoxin system
VIHLDTHVVAWLYAGEFERIPLTVQARIEADMLAVSPMVLLELDYLHEIGRTREGSAAVLAVLEARLDLRVSEAPFPRIARIAAALSFTRDPFDRLIAATAMAEDLPLLTADRRMLEHCPVAIWDS